ncbi:MAG: hypothetical protein PHQ12_09285 [Chthoniobacteraceae bacterium]|nr:hypothetical protein [Chthoniobacteraceae bacterium]
MDTHKYDSISLRTMLGTSLKGALLLGAAAALFLCAPSQARAVTAPLDDSGFNGYALIFSGGNFNISQTTVTGNSGFVNVSSIGGSNHDTFDGNLSYTKSNFSLGDNTKITVTGNTSLDTSTAAGSLSSALQSAQAFSANMLQLASTQTLSNFTNGTLVSNASGINVINLTGANAGGSITLSGGADDVFYINVSAMNLNLNKVQLAGDVKAENVYWNIVNGGNSNLSGDLIGTFFGFSNSTLSFSHTTLDGAVFGGSLSNMDHVNITGLAGDDGTAALVPETSSYAALGVFAALLLGSSLRRWWLGRRRGENGLILDAASV